MQSTTAAGRERLFNPRCDEFIQNPYPLYRELRENDPVWLSPRGLWVLTRHEDVKQFLGDPRFGHAQDVMFALAHGPEILKEPAFRNACLSMLVQDGEAHRRTRALVHRAFGASRVRDMQRTIQGIVDRLLLRIASRGEADLMRDFARPLPVHVICEMLGVPHADRARFVRRRVVSERIFLLQPMTREEIDRENARFLELSDYFTRLIRARRQDPGDDLISALALARDDQGALSMEEVVSNVILLFAAGHDTTVNLIGNGLLALFDNRDQLDLLRANPRLIGPAVDELLRYDSPVQTAARVTFDDVEVGGVTIPRHQRVVAVLGAANRDPAVYDDPDRLDITRDGPKTLAFGGGAHFCLGAQLARLEARVALGTLLGRFADLRLPSVDAPDWDRSVILRGLGSLPARWSVIRPRMAA